jgi:hypothetical protein
LSFSLFLLPFHNPPLFSFIFYFLHLHNLR